MSPKMQSKAAKKRTEPVTIHLPHDRNLTSTVHEDGSHTVTCEYCNQAFNLGPTLTTRYFKSHWQSCDDIYGKHSSQYSHLSLNQTPVLSTPIITLATPTQSPPNIPSLPDFFTSSPTPRLVNVPISSACKGFSIKLEHIYQGYPFAMHENPNMGWHPEQFHKDKNMLTFHASSCLGNLADKETGSCNPCLSVANSRQFQDFIEDTKQQSEPHTSYKYLTLEKAMILLNKLSKTVHDLRAEVCVLLNRFELSNCQLHR